MEWNRHGAVGHRSRDKSVSPQQKHAEAIPSYWKKDLEDVDDSGEWRNIMKMAIQQRSHLGNLELPNSSQQGELKYSDVHRQYHQSRGLPMGDGATAAVGGAKGRGESSGRRSTDKELVQGHQKRGRRSSGSSRASSTRDSENEKKDRDKDVVSIERKMHELQRQLAEERQMSRREKITIARLQQELSRSKSKTMMREGLMKEVDHERILRMDAERRLHEVTIESDACKARLQNLQQDFSKMDDMVRSMVQYKSKIEQLKQEKASLSCSYENNIQKYRTHISNIEHENMILIGQIQSLESQQSSCYYCKQDLDYRVRQPGLSREGDKSKLLLERLKNLEGENSSLVLENENQRTQYEKCLDEIANQVVQALLTQKSLREECMKLQGRVRDLESQNKQLNVMFQQRMRYASDSLLQSYPSKKLTRSKLNGSTDSKGSGSQDSYHSLPVNTQAFSFITHSASRHSSGNSMHSVDSGDFLMNGDSLYNAAAQPQPSEPPAWLREKLAGKLGVYSPDSPESPEGQPREARALESPSGSQSGMMTPRTKINYLLHQSQLANHDSPSGSIISSGSRIETEFPASNESPKMKRVDYVQRGRHSRQASYGSVSSVGVHSRSSNGSNENKPVCNGDAGIDRSLGPRELDSIKNNLREVPSTNRGSNENSLDKEPVRQNSCRYRYVEEFYDNVGQSENGADFEELRSGTKDHVLSQNILTNNTTYPDISPGRELLKLSDAFEEKYTVNKDGLPEIESKAEDVNDGELSPRSKHLSIASSVSLDELLEGEACDTDDEITDFDDFPSSPSKVMVDSCDSVKLESSDTESVQTMRKAASNEFSSVASDLSSASTIQSREVSIDREASSSPRPMTLKIASLEKMLEDVANQKPNLNSLPPPHSARVGGGDIGHNGHMGAFSVGERKQAPPVPAKPRLSNNVLAKDGNRSCPPQGQRKRHESSESIGSNSSVESSSLGKVRNIKAYFENNKDVHSAPTTTQSPSFTSGMQNGVVQTRHNDSSLSHYQSVVGYCYRDDVPNNFTGAQFSDIFRDTFNKQSLPCDNIISAPSLAKANGVDRLDSGIYEQDNSGYHSSGNTLPSNHSNVLTVDVQDFTNNKEKSLAIERSLVDSGVECYSPLGSSTSSNGSGSRSSPQMMDQMKTKPDQSSGFASVKDMGMIAGTDTEEPVTTDSSDDDDHKEASFNFLEMWKKRAPLKLPDWDPKKRLQEATKTDRPESQSCKADLREMDELLLKIDVGDISTRTFPSQSTNQLVDRTLSCDRAKNPNTPLCKPQLSLMESTRADISPTKTMLEDFDKEWDDLCKRAKIVSLKSDCEGGDCVSVADSVTPNSDLTSADVETKFRKEFYSLCRIESHKSLNSGTGLASSEPNLKVVSPDFPFKSIPRSFSNDQLRLQHEFIHGCGDHEIEDNEDIAQQIADLSQTVNELQQSLTSLNSSNSEYEHRDLNKSITDSESSQKYHWFDDISSSPADGVIKDSDWLLANDLADNRDAADRNPVNSDWWAGDSGDGVTSRKCQINTDSKKSSVKDIKEQQFSDPGVRADLLDMMLTPSCQARVDTFNGLDENIARMMRHRRGKLEVVRQTSVTRPALDTVKLFVRYGEQEKDAMSKFDFLNEISSSETESLSGDVSAGNERMTRSRTEIEERLGFPSGNAVPRDSKTVQCKNRITEQESMEFVSDNGSLSDLSNFSSLDRRLHLGDFTDEILNSLEQKFNKSDIQEGLTSADTDTLAGSDDSSIVNEDENGFSFSDSCCEEFSGDETGTGA